MRSEYENNFNLHLSQAPKTEEEITKMSQLSASNTIAIGLDAGTETSYQILLPLDTMLQRHHRALDPSPSGKVLDPIRILGRSP